MKGRGNKIVVPEHWLERCRAWVQEQEETVRSLGPKLGAVIDRETPFSKATVSCYLRGERVTDELTEAFARLMGVSFPVPQPKNDAQRRWFELGVELDEVDHELFLEELEHVEELVETCKKLARLLGGRPTPKR